MRDDPARPRTLRPFLAALVALSLAALACNLTPSGSPTSLPTSSVLPTQADDGSRPQIVIESPVTGAQAVLRQAFSIQIRATDSIGITRVEIRQGGRVVIQQPSPDPVTVFEALLPYTPSAAGALTLEAVAYRREIASDPASVTIEVVSSPSELRNPASLDPTAGFASGAAICVVRVKVNNLNLRQGPGTRFAVIAKLRLGEELTVIGRNEAATWYQIRRANTPDGWVSADYAAPVTACGPVPVVTPAPG